MRSTYDKKVRIPVRVRYKIGVTDLRYSYRATHLGVERVHAKRQEMAVGQILRGAFVAGLAVAAMFGSSRFTILASVFEAHVVNVTAKIEPRNDEVPECTSEGELCPEPSEDDEDHDDEADKQVTQETQVTLESQPELESKQEETEKEITEQETEEELAIEEEQLAEEESAKEELAPTPVETGIEAGVGEQVEIEPPKEEEPTDKPPGDEPADQAPVIQRDKSENTAENIPEETETVEI